MSLNILIVDDSETVRAVIARTLDLAEIPVKELFQAGNGREGLLVLDRQGINLVFADLFMPVMTGLEMVQKMSAAGLLKSIPVIVISSEGSATRIHALKALGISAFIHKPFTPEIIRRAVYDVMGGANEHRAD